MSAISLGDLAMTFVQRRQNLSLRDQMQTASTELVTGRLADPALRFRGDFSPLAAVEGSLSRLTAHRAAAGEAALLAQTMQTALDTLGSLASGASESLVSAALSRNGARLASAGDEAAARLSSALSALNTRLGDRAAFAGTAAEATPLPDAEAILQALDPLVAASATPDQAAAAVAAWFADPAGLSALYAGGPGRAPMSIAPGESVTLDITAMDPGILGSLQGLALGAMLGRGHFAGDIVAQADLSDRAAATLRGAEDSRIDLAARLGVAEARIAEARTRMEAETTALSLARETMLAADPYEAATRLEQAEVQLQSLYTVTARLSRLSLADYI